MNRLKFIFELLLFLQCLIHFDSYLSVSYADPSNVLDVANNGTGILTPSIDGGQLSLLRLGDSSSEMSSEPGGKTYSKMLSYEELAILLWNALH